jgi:hypothetical protein
VLLLELSDVDSVPDVLWQFPIFIILPWIPTTAAVNIDVRLLFIIVI